MKTFPFAIGLLSLAGASYADIVFLNSGQELGGTVQKIDSEGVVLEAEGGPQTYPRGEVLKVKLVREYRIPGSLDAAQVSDETLRGALKSPAKPEEYPDDGYLTYLDEQACELKPDMSSICLHKKIRLILRERGKDEAANARFYHLAGSQIGRIDYARSISGGRVFYLDDTSVQEGAEHAGVPSYDRLKSTKFSLPNVSTGSVLDYRYRIETAAHVSTVPFFGRMFFRSMEPAVLSRLTVTVPSELALAFAERSMPPDVRAGREESGGTTRYVWETGRTPSIKEEERMPPYARLAPAVTFGLADSWEKIAEGLSGFLNERQEVPVELSEKVEELLKDQRTGAGKVEALYNWVAKEIKFQPIHMSEYSYVPKTPAEIFQAKEGNMLDKPFLLYVMLVEAGFEPELVYMEVKSGSPFEPAVPSLGQLEAAAVALDLDGSRLFLAPFDDSFRYREIPSWLQGMNGLVVLGPKSGTLFFNPLSSAEAESEAFQTRLELKADGSIEGAETIRPLGSQQAGWRGLKDLKKEALDKQFEEIAHSIHPNARLSTYSVENLEDPTRDIAVHLSYSVQNYAITAAGGFLAFRIPWVEHSAQDVGQPARESPLFWYERDRMSKDVRVALPAGYELYYAPEAVRLEGPDGAYRAAYSPAEGALAFSEERVRDLTELPIEKYPEYKRYREEMARFTEKWIVLKKK